MTTRMKYITFDSNAGLLCVLFHEAITHGQMVMNMELAEGNILGAGFVEIYADQNNVLRVRCSERSVTLKKGPGPRDEEIISRTLNLEEQNILSGAMPIKTKG